MKIIYIIYALILLTPFQSAQASVFEEEDLLSNTELKDERGTGGLSPDFFSDSELFAAVTGNTVENPVTGSNTIGDHALTGNSGIVSIIQNSGNGVVIQNSTVVNLSMTP